MVTNIMKLQLKSSMTTYYLTCLAYVCISLSITLDDKSDHDPRGLVTSPIRMILIVKIATWHISRFI